MKRYVMAAATLALSLLAAGSIVQAAGLSAGTGADVQTGAQAQTSTPQTQVQQLQESESAKTQTRTDLSAPNTSADQASRTTESQRTNWQKESTGSHFNSSLNTAAQGSTKTNKSY